jgi:hypothetical protein
MVAEDSDQLRRDQANATAMHSVRLAPRLAVTISARHRNDAI